MGDQNRDGDPPRRGEMTFGGTTHRLAYHEGTTDRVRFSERSAVHAFSPAIPELPPDDEDPSDDQTIPDHSARLAFGQTMSAIDHLHEVTLLDGGRSKLTPTPPGSRSPETAVPGAILAERYVVVRVIGEGGMGKVVEVTHTRLGKIFACKLLHEHLAADDSIRLDFFREAKFASSLDHPNILSVVDFGEDPRYGAYMVMEFIEGEPLSEVLAKRKRLNARRSCDVVLQLAEALRHIHRHEIVHCDIKTRNILLCDDPSDKRRQSLVKLLDFGLARSMSQGAPDRLFGTPEYLAPELAQRQKPSARSDIYSVGILLFELIAGRVPFRGAAAAVVRAHLEKALPRPSEILGHAVDPALEKLIMTACDKDPERRHKDMSAFLYELRTVMDMLGFPRQRRGGAAAGMTTSQAPTLPDRRSEVVRSTFDNFRLPIATLDASGEIIAANSAFSKFVVGMIVKLEGMKIQETLLARAWHALEDDLAIACAGEPVARLIELDGRDAVTRLQMWLEPTGLPGYACFSVHPLDAPPPP